MFKYLCFHLLLFSIPFSYASFDTLEIQKFQYEFDEEYFEINRDFEKLRHVLLHLMKSTGKIAAYCEAKEHKNKEASPNSMINEVLPDLLIHALQIANLYEVDLGEKYEKRIQFIIDRSKRGKPIESLNQEIPSNRRERANSRNEDGS